VSEEDFSKPQKERKKFVFGFLFANGLVLCAQIFNNKNKYFFLNMFFLN
jgi:hypothetical protein